MEPSSEKIKLIYLDPHGARYDEIAIQQEIKKKKRWPYKSIASYPHADSPIIHACRTGQNDIVLHFLQDMGSYSFSSPSKNQHNESIIHLACENGNFKILHKVTKLCYMSDGMFSKNQAGLNPLAILAKKSHLQGIILLLCNTLNGKNGTIKFQLQEPNDPLTIALNDINPDIPRAFIAYNRTCKKKFSLEPFLFQYPRLNQLWNEASMGDWMKLFDRKLSLSNRFTHAINLGKIELLHAIATIDTFYSNLFRYAFEVSFLELALKYKNSSLIWHLIELGLKYKDVAKKGLFFLHAIVRWEDWNLLKVVHKQQMEEGKTLHVDINAHDETGTTPFILLCQQIVSRGRILPPDFEAIELLVNLGAKVLEASSQGITSIKIAADGGLTFLVDTLRILANPNGITGNELSKNDRGNVNEQDYKSIFDLLNKGDEYGVLVLLNKLVREGLKEVIHIQDLEGYPLIYRALEHKCNYVVAFLVWMDVTLHTKAVDGTSLALHAQRKGAQEVIKFIEACMSYKQNHQGIETKFFNEQILNHPALAFFLFKMGAKPSRDSYRIAFKKEAYLLATEMLEGGVIPEPQELPKLPLEAHFFIKEWLRKLTDPVLRFEEAYSRNIDSAESFDVLFHSEAAFLDKVWASLKIKNHEKFHLLIKNDLFSQLNVNESWNIWKQACGTNYHFVEILIEAGFDPLLKDAHDNSGLHWAAAASCPGVVKHLSQRLEVNAVNKKGQRPLDLMENRGGQEAANARCVEYLLAKGASLRSYEQTLLFWSWCLKPSNLACKRLILLQQPEWGVLIASSLNDGVSLSQLLTELQLPLELNDEDQKKLLDVLCVKRDFPTWIAAHQHRLLDFKKYGKKLLFHAADKHSTHLIRYMMEHELCNIHEKNEGFTPLDFIAKDSNYTPTWGLIHQMIVQGIVVEKQETQNALWKGYIKHLGVTEIQCLVQKNVPFTVELHEETPLHYAIQRQEISIIELVCSYSYPVNHCNQKDETALSLLCSSRLCIKNPLLAAHLIDLLINKGADFSVGVSPLLALCHNYWKHEIYEVPQALLKKFINHPSSVSQAISYYEEIDWKENVTKTTYTGGYYNTYTKIGNTTYHAYSNSQPVAVHEVIKVIDHLRSEKAPLTYNYLKRNKSL